MQEEQSCCFQRGRTVRFLQVQKVCLYSALTEPNKFPFTPFFFFFPKKRLPRLMPFYFNIEVLIYFFVFDNRLEPKHVFSFFSCWYSDMFLS